MKDDFDALVNQFVKAAQSLALTVHRRGTEAQKQRTRDMLLEALDILEVGETKEKSPSGS